MSSQDSQKAIIAANRKIGTEFVNRLTPKRRAVLDKLAKAGTWLNWDDAEWWIEGREHESLHPQTCFWLVRNGFVTYAEDLNDVVCSPNYGLIGYRITPLGYNS